MSKRLKDLEREIELTKELIELQEKLNVLKNQPCYPYPVYVPQPYFPQGQPWPTYPQPYIGDFPNTWKRVY